MTKKALIARLETLLGDLKKRNREYSGASEQQRRFCESLLDANRYEGIAKGSRWAAEDLKEILDSVKG